MGFRSRNFQISESAPGHVPSEKDADEDEDLDEGGQVKKTPMLYTVDQYPPVLMTIFLAFQQFTLSFGGCLTASVIVSRLICVGKRKVVQAELLNTFFVISGLCTFLQSTFGVRIPTMQSSSSAFLVAVESLFAARKETCEDLPGLLNGTNMTVNGTVGGEEIWKLRIREIQGAIILAGLTHAVIGFFGLVGFLMTFIGPITVAVTIMSIGIQMGSFVLGLCQRHWGIAFLTAALVLIFSMYLRNWSPKLPVYNRKRGCYTARYPIQKILSVLLALLLSWLLCFILTVSGALSTNPNDYSYNARTDLVSDVINDAKWIYIPYPGQWGDPTFTVTGYLAMIIPTIASILESIGDYHACAEVCQLPPPPVHALNRGVFMEGVGSVLAGAYGGGGSITSYSQNAGVISLTKAASRFIFQITSLFFLVFGIIGKFGAALTAIPTPVVGGTVLASVAMIFGVAFGNLSKVDIKSSRNQMVIGMSLLIGIIMPTWVNTQGDIIKTGSTLFDNVLKILLRTSMFISGVLACFLDNTLPGTREERGMTSWRLEKDKSGNELDYSAYDFPYVMPWLRRHTFASIFPIMPVYKKPSCSWRSSKKSKETMTDGVDNMAVDMEDMNTNKV